MRSPEKINPTEEPKPRLSKEGAEQIERNIEELAKPIRTIVEQLRPAIDGGQYGAIIGDDASGRIPTLIFRKIISTVYQRSGWDSPQTLFLAGSRNAKSPPDKRVDIQKYLSQHLKTTGKLPENRSRVLLVTDTIVTGSSLRPMTESLKNMAQEFDIATVAFDSDSDDLKILEEKLGAKIFFGETDKTPNIYYSLPRMPLHIDLVDVSMHGVIKNSDNLLAMKKTLVTPRR